MTGGERQAGRRDVPQDRPGSVCPGRPLSTSSFMTCRSTNSFSGAGVVEAVLIGGLVAAGGAADQVTAAVLVYRALTWALPILVGIVCYPLRRRQSLASGRHTAGPSTGGSVTAAPEGLCRSSPPP
jgi:hypothetical protein